MQEVYTIINLTKWVTMEYLAISALVSHQSILVDEIIQLTAKFQCNIEDSRITSLGSEIGVIMLISGNWSAIAKLETVLANLEEKIPVTIQIKRTEIPKRKDTILPYIVQVVALNDPGLVFDITNFFVSQDIILNDLQTNPFVANYTETHMNTMMMSISVPASISISDLRERFMLLCDELNVDGIIEPEKR